MSTNATPIRKGEPMPHKFDPKNIGRLDNPERMKILPPKEILLDLGLKSDNIMLDIGAGIGYFTFPATEIVGNSGKVVAVDTSKEMLKELQSRVSQSCASNIEIVLSQEYDFPVNRSYFDFALMSTVLHEIEDKPRFLKAAGSVLKKNGTLAVIEWIKRPMERGPSVTDRIEVSEVEKLLVLSGFSEVKSWNYNEYFYLVVGQKS
ncbi:MAG: methyltransferase [Candidatus Margulisiibacteriota bacterium]|nr:MAG: methyltransferase [Candidatus Margulisiibacteriota bacterium]HAR64216.1 methyltransferase [Candidatus Margulisiibacteriota bacterium]HCT85295.1 methyltransferase [Candidatus Margulisiibacteriota bacterium]HCY36120.1 methyltransferase [Candidatus Margulisiibacteriota bacterium]